MLSLNCNDGVYSVYKFIEKKDLSDKWNYIVSEAYYEPLMLEIPSPMFHSCLWSCVNKPFVSLFNLFLSYLCN